MAGERLLRAERCLPAPGGGPGHVALDLPDVARAAAYREGVSLPGLWQEWRRLPSSNPHDLVELRRRHANKELRERLTEYHEAPRAFYGRSAERGWPEAKNLSF